MSSKYDVDYFRKAKLLPLRVFNGNEELKYVTEIIPESKSIVINVIDEYGNHTVVDDEIKSEIVPVESLKLIGKDGEHVCLDSWW
ncbi:hypothetical protein VPH159E362A_0072 [Vibrio phage 159E36-2a]